MTDMRAKSIPDSRSNDPVPNHFRIDVAGGIGYCYIRKNACSAFKKMIVETSANLPEYGRHPVGPDRMQFMQKYHKLRGRTLGDLAGMILILRDPMERIVSGFVNQFVMRLDRPSEKMHGAVEKVISKPAAEVTFGDFTRDYLAKVEWKDVNKHFLPQIEHVVPMVYTHVVWHGNLQGDVQNLLGRELAERYLGRPANSTAHMTNGDFDKADQLRADTLFREFRNCRKLPSKGSLLSGSMRELLASIYADDLSLYDEFRLRRDEEEGAVKMDMSSLNARRTNM